MTRDELIAMLMDPAKAIPGDAIMCIGTSDGRVEEAFTLDVEKFDSGVDSGVQVTILCYLEKLWGKSKS